MFGGKKEKKILNRNLCHHLKKKNQAKRKDVEKVSKHNKYLGTVATGEKCLISHQ